MATLRVSELIAAWEDAKQHSDDRGFQLPALPDQYRYGFGRTADHRDVVCSACVDDEALRRFAFTHEPADACHFCGRADDPQTSVDDLFAYVYRSLLREYEDPSTSHLMFDKEEESWFGVIELDTSDVLHDAGAPLGDGSTLHELFCTAVDHDWYVLESEVGTTDQRFVWSWQSFKERLRSGPRFLFDTDRAEYGEFSVADIFGHFDTSAAQLQTELVKVAEPGLILLRARGHEADAFATATELGPPPADRVRSGRMNPEGVPVFYASEDRATAVAEIRPDPSAVVTVGEWTSTREIRYIDLAEPIALPSLFDSSFAHTRPFVRFCNAFASEISQPILEDGVPANEYLPTQILTEHLRYKMPTYAGPGVEAIRFPSSFTSEANWVVFVDSAACGEAGSGSVLELERASSQ